MRRGLSVLVVVLLVAGCTTVPADLAADQPAERTRLLAGMVLEDDKRTGWINAFAPPVTSYENADRRTYRIRSRLDAGADSRGKPFQLYVEAMFPKRVFLKQAYANGAELDTIVIDRERKSTGTLEIVGINLTEADMDAYARTGLDFRVVGRRAELVLAVPAVYFQAALEFHRRSAGARTGA